MFHVNKTLTRTTLCRCTGWCYNWSRLEKEVHMNGPLIAVKGKTVKKPVTLPSGKKLTINVFVPKLDKNGNPKK